MTDLLTALTEAGVSIWLDDLSRERMISSDLATLVEARHGSGVTTNPSIFAKFDGAWDKLAEQFATTLRDRRGART